ncbi:spondin-1-like [Melitaea cinxia]|uniref:spondin-1-like n=1 Tax=Melitaea cinxia TaxID=113334 RepID=UPI001E273B22|nr:spondin-1-like [Melitaea cinxia]
MIIIFFTVLLFLNVGQEVFGFRCDRRPYGTTTQSSDPDGRFKLLVENTDESYIPDQLYTVKITETDGESRFTEFMISAEGEMKADPVNTRKMMLLFPGELRPQDPFSAKFSSRCLYSVEHAISSPKSFVEVYWQAPPSGNGCVTLRAMVAEHQDVWYEDGFPLSLRLCEDLRQPDDATPQLNLDCDTCDEAKYELTFTGTWSRNTHPRFYPENDWIPRYSDLVGASHAADYILWAPGTLVSEGFREFAEHANGSKLEGEIREKIGDGVRTLIKGKGHGYRKMSDPTYAFFRTDKTNHLVTVAVALHPSPDWFLGVTRFELCQKGNMWLEERELNLYLWDAGTDSGVSYESPNIETFPQDAVSRVQTSSYDKNSPFYEMDMKDLHPFGKLLIKLIRTYQKECKEEKEEETTQEAVTSTDEPVTTEAIEGEEKEDESDKEKNEDKDEDKGEPDSPSSEAAIVTDPDSSEDCPMSQWQEWSQCGGACENGKIVGYKWRERYHLVDGIPVEKYDPDIDPSSVKEVPRVCKTHYEDFEREECEDDCPDHEEETNLTAERRVMSKVAPGYGWNSKSHLKRTYF